MHFFGLIDLFLYHMHMWLMRVFLVVFIFPYSGLFGFSFACSFLKRERGVGRGGRISEELGEKKH